MSRVARTLSIQLGLVAAAGACLPPAQAQEDATASAPASSRPTPSSTLALLARGLEDVDGIAVLTFPTPCFACRTSDISPEEVSDFSNGFILGPASIDTIRRTLSSPDSFISGLSKPCAQFYPSFGLRLQSRESSAVLLVFSECKTARLVTADRVPHEFLNIDPCIDRLRRILLSTGSTS